MKKLNVIWIILVACFINIAPILGQSDSKKDKIIADSNTAKAEFIKTDHLMKAIFDNAQGYVIFPNVGKGGVGVGGAAGNGAVYEKGKLIGMAKLTQLSIGLQAGGQAYREVIFFETKEGMDHFKESKFEFAAQASAVAVSAGVSGNAKYTDGVMVFTMEKGGLMYEASVGGQKFKFDKM
ncbi:YSC84-related protein [Flavobacterium aestivum]|uniref:lipid-binding SYLF domain-containing protein n=1 Tax=Flavobacterium aestivum TaxID=3003257 RepID=UPI002482D04F|nr:YSC84-related protein [Flavobacterium aestivum]